MMKAALLALHEKRITMDEFLTETMGYWRTMGKNMHRSNPALGMDADDVVQQLIVHFIEGDRVSSWEGLERHGTLMHYCIYYHARSLTQRDLYRARGIPKATGRGEAREHLSQSSTDVHEFTPAVSFSIDAWLDADALPKTDPERLVVESLKRHGTVDAVSDELGVSRGTILGHARTLAKRAS